MESKQKGISLIQMVITIVMMMLIALFAVFNSRDTITETKLSRVYDEMVKVKQAVMGTITLNENYISEIGTKVEDFSSYPQLASYYSTGQEYYFLDFKTKGDVLQEILELRNIENNYIVNVKNLQNIEIFLIDGVKIGGTLYYSDSEILEKYNEIFAGR